MVFDILQTQQEINRLDGSDPRTKELKADLDYFIKLDNQSVRELELDKKCKVDVDTPIELRSECHHDCYDCPYADDSLVLQSIIF